MYPAWWNSDITILHKTVDSETEETVWTAQQYTNCFWASSAKEFSHEGSVHYRNVVTACIPSAEALDIATEDYIIRSGGSTLTAIADAGTNDVIAFLEQLESSGIRTAKIDSVSDNIRDFLPHYELRCV